MKILIITVGVGRTIDQGIMRSINVQNPDMVVFLFTPESREKHASLVERVWESGKKAKEHELSSEADTDTLVLECVSILKKYHVDEHRVSIDFTFGTKAMTAAVYTAGLMVGLQEASYVEGERDQSTGGVISGTERVKVMNYNIPRAVMLSQRVINLYNSCYYDGALQIMRQIKDSFAHAPKSLKKIEALYHLCYVAYRWDKFEFHEAAEGTRRMLDYVLETGSLLQIESDENHLRNQITEMANYLDNLADEEMNPYLAWELLEAAERRARTGRWDDAVARLYRTLEFIGQRALHEKGLFEENRFKSPAEGGLPRDLSEMIDHNRPLGLSNVYRFLFYIQHPLGLEFVEEDDLKTDVGEALSARNRSILAHGFKPIGEDNYRKLKSFALRALRIAGINRPRFRICSIRGNVF